MPEPTQAPDQSQPADGGIDLSAGMVPKQAPADSDIDLSAGMVPKPAAQPRTGNTGVAGVLSGIGGGIFDTAQGAKELVNKALPNSMQIPDVPAALRTQDTPSEHVGGFLESMGEFATGDELLEGATKLAKLEKLAKGSEWLTKALDSTPGLIKKIVGSAVKSATVGGAQGAVKGAAEGDAAGGAEGGAIGGALGGAAGEVTGAVAKPIASKLGLATTAEEDAMRAFQPSKRNTQFLQNWQLAKDRLVKEIAEGDEFKSPQDAADRIRNVRQKLWGEEVTPVIEKHANDLVDTKPIVDAINKSASASMKRNAPEQAEVVEEFAKKYGQPTSLKQLEEDLEHFNAELSDKDFYKKSAGDRAQSVKVNGAIAARDSAVKAMREAIYDHLDANGEPGMKELKQTYGAMSSLESDIRGQANVAGRQKPISLKQIVGAGAGIAHGGIGGAAMGIGVPLLDKLYNSPEALLNRAVSKSAPAGPVKAAIQKVAPAAASSFRTGTAAVGSEAGQWIKVKAGDGQTYEVHPEDLPELQKRDPAAQPIN